MTSKRANRSSRSTAPTISSGTTGIRASGASNATSNDTPAAAASTSSPRSTAKIARYRLIRRACGPIPRRKLVSQLSAGSSSRTVPLSYLYLDQEGARSHHAPQLVQPDEDGGDDQERYGSEQNHRCNRAIAQRDGQTDQDRKSAEPELKRTVVLSLGLK